MAACGRWRGPTPGPPDVGGVLRWVGEAGTASLHIVCIARCAKELVMWVAAALSEGVGSNVQGAGRELGLHS